MYYKALSFLIIAVTLCGCSHKKLDTSLQRLKGKNIDVAINYLGLPDNKFTIDNKDVFVWGREDTKVVNKPITTYSGYNSGSGAFGGVGIVFGAPYARNESHYYCKIKIVTDQYQMIEKVERDSTAGACSKYNEAVEKIERDNL